MKLKALSFRQPWANLVLDGRKTLDLRTWTTKYRGPLAVYASLDVEKEACRAQGMDTATLTTGALVGLVDLVDILPLEESEYKARAYEHLNGRAWREGLYGWVLANPRWLEAPQVAKGRLNLFDVVIPDVEGLMLKVEGEREAVEGQKSKIEKTLGPRPDTSHLPPDTSHPASHTSHLTPDTAITEFELRVIPENGSRYRLAFSQNLSEKPQQGLQYRPEPPKTRVEVELGGDALHILADLVLDTLRQNGYKATDLAPARRAPFRLNETSGVRLGLIFLAAKPLTKTSRIEQISQGVRAMTSEELFYWYSKCTAGPAIERAQKAMRVLLADE